MFAAVEGVEWAAKVPTDLPIYNIAGDQDPVGMYGEGVYQVSNWLARTGHDVITELYTGFRHEIHNYEDLKDEVILPEEMCEQAKKPLDEMLRLAQ